MKVGASLNLFPGWRKVLHPLGWLLLLDKPLQPSASQGGDTTTRVLGKGELDAKGWEECLQVNQADQDSMSPARSPEPMPEVGLPPGFKEVMACL